MNYVIMMDNLLISDIIIDMNYMWYHDEHVCRVHWVQSVSLS